MSTLSSSDLNQTFESDDLSKSVFVTQINEREDENSIGVINRLVVKESSSTLLKTGLNTFQETLVVKKESELNSLHIDFLEKRREHETRMTKCLLKKQSILSKQRALMDQMKSFDSFIKENDAKRKRALVKYQNEVRLIELEKHLEIELLKEINQKKLLHEKLLKKVQHNKKYEDFLFKVIEMMPPDYIKVSENILGGLIMRYNTLFSTNELLMIDMSKKSEDIQFYTNLIRELKEENSRQLLQNNYRLSKMYEEYEKLKDKLERGEQHFKMKHGDVRNEILNFGLTLRAVDNITKKCVRRFDENIAEDDIENKLEKIKNYIITNKQIIEMVSQSKDKSICQLPPVQKPNGNNQQKTLKTSKEEIRKLL